MYQNSFLCVHLLGIGSM